MEKNKIFEIITSFWLQLVLASIVVFLIFSNKIINTSIHSLNISSKAGLFLTIASIIGILFAIYMSMVLLVIQHSSTNYLPSVLNKFKKDSKFMFIIFLTLISIIFNIYIYGSENDNFMILSYGLSILSFLSIILYFYEIINLINPLVSLDRLMNKIKKQISQNYKLANKLNKIEKSHPILKRMKFLISNHRFINDKKLLDSHKKYVDEIFFHIEKSEARNDPETYSKATDCIIEFVKYYFSYKKMDSQTDLLLEHIYTKLEILSYDFFKRNQHFKLNEIINVYKEIGLVSFTLKVLHLRGHNYTASLPASYLNKIGKKSVEIDDLDLTKEVILSLKEIGLKSIKENSTTNHVEEYIAELSLAAKHQFIYSSGLFSINELFVHLFSGKQYSDYHNLNKSSKKIIISILVNVKSYMNQNVVFAPLFGMASKVHLKYLFASLIKISQLEIKKEIGRRYLEETSKKEISNLIKVHEEIINILIEAKLNWILDDYAETFKDVILMLSNTKLKTYKQDYLDEIKKLISLLFKCNINDKFDYKIEKNVLALIYELLKIEKIREDILPSIFEDIKKNKAVLRESFLENILFMGIELYQTKKEASILKYYKDISNKNSVKDLLTDKLKKYKETPWRYSYSLIDELNFVNKIVEKLDENLIIEIEKKFEKI